MGLNFARYLCISILLSFVAIRQGPHIGAQSQDQDVQVIQMTARKYEFTPSQVHVKVGIKVRLKITATDRDHGFTIMRDPIGNDTSAHPGLEFMSPAGSDGWTLKRDKETVIEFVAKAPGTYEFNCSLACGIHHGRMKGELVVGR